MSGFGSRPIPVSIHALDKSGTLTNPIYVRMLLVAQQSCRAADNAKVSASPDAVAIVDRGSDATLLTHPKVSASPDDVATLYRVSDDTL